ncbi:ion transporter [Nesterenkonia salmonea]|uniref:Ion transporter n=1 Tax=Nesterenkonia salmonea TaxID=1804987 RepID=A0A5R9B947_9MICC|nr:ion transporter [Nesterenkonia salmonea]TLP92879.1 ion transporter [Nesterenkonia salmonea]
MNTRASEEEDESQSQAQAAKASAAARELADTAMGHKSEERTREIEERWETWLAWPVMIAALVSVPAVFLTLLDEPFEMIGHIGLWATSVVLVFETLVLFLVSPKKVEWLRKNWWLVGLTILVIVGVVFSIGPMQILRLLRSVGALRVLRAKQVAKAGHSLQKTGTSRLWQHLGTLLATLVVSAFVVVALADPESPVRSFLDDLVGEEWAIATAVGAGVLLFAATYLLVRQPRDKGEESTGHNAAESGDDDSEPDHTTAR